jgi:hypothetical protein
MKKLGSEGNSTACQLGEIAAIVCAPDLEGFSGAELLTRALFYETAERGLPGRGI